MELPGVWAQCHAMQQCWYTPHRQQSAQAHTLADREELSDSEMARLINFYQSRGIIRNIHFRAYHIWEKGLRWWVLDVGQVLFASPNRCCLNAVPWVVRKTGRPQQCRCHDARDVACLLLMCALHLILGLSDDPEFLYYWVHFLVVVVFVLINLTVMLEVRNG